MPSSKEYREEERIENRIDSWNSGGSSHSSRACNKINEVDSKEQEADNRILTFEDEKRNEIWSSDKEALEEKQLNYDYKNNSIIEMDNNKNGEKYQSNCGDGSNLINKPKNKETKYNEPKIKAEIYCSKNNNLYESVKEKTINPIKKFVNKLKH